MGQLFSKKYQNDKVVNGLGARYTSHSYVRALFYVFEVGRMGSFGFISNAEGTAAEGFVIHYARSKGFGVNHRLVKPGSFGHRKGAKKGPLPIQVVSISYW